MFFVTIAILDGFFVYTALSTHSGVVTKNSYEKGLNYNDAIEQAEISKDLNQQIIFQDLENLKAEIVYSIDADIEEAIVIVKRPIEQGKDFESKLTSNNSNNNYSAIISFPERGNWDLLVIAKAKNAEYRKKKRIFIKQ